MINPNKIYPVKGIGVITKIERLDSYIPYLYVLISKETREYDGPVKCYSHPEKLKVGDRVKIGVQWSITSDRPVIRSLRRVIK